ncbi:MAG TPA: aspartyl/asparaginyl beta-hydroxylase domain-containing protein [Candidatus Dormibacteraeota bacterium]|nr:aspartyl/asparaginyl beta-hydroxylase domain-containing protein [Candidatus Dormibacteraeota bacterium]
MVSAPCFRLPLCFDVERLQADLDVLERRPWPPERPFIMRTPFPARTMTYHDGKWRGLALRSQGGDPERTDPGGPGLDAFADTELLAQAPAIREVVDSLDCEKRSVRLLLLPPDAEVHPHTDPYHGFKYGQLRLHVPIRTHPDVRMRFGDEAFHWPAGELWYADFGRPHAVENRSRVTRVHLVIDALVTPALLRLFPEDVVAAEDASGILLHPPAVPATADELRRYACDYRMPAALVQGLLETDDGSVPGELGGQVRLDGGRLVLELEGTPLFALEPIGGHRFRLCGWTQERSVEFRLGGAHGAVDGLVVVLRAGRAESRIELPATPVG